MSTRTRPFSIFLLKNGYDATNSLKENNLLNERVVARNLPENSTLYVLDSQPRPPWWKDYFRIEQDLQQSSKGALLFVPVENRYFALSFGHVYHNLLDNCYEYDFGLRVTLNCADPYQLKSADIVDPGTSRRKRTQVPAASDLTFLDFDSNAEVIKSITGAVKKEYAELFKTASGSASLKIGLKIDPDELIVRCERLLALYYSEDYLETFPNVGKISPEKDPDIVEALDEKLLEKFIERSEDISLSIPDIIDYRDNTSCRFQGRGGGVAEVYTSVSLEAFYDYLGRDFNYDDLTINKLKKFSIALCDADGQISKSYSIYNCLLLDVVEPDKVFHICEGGWYRVDIDYINELTRYLNERFEKTDLIQYDHDMLINGTLHYSEETYNAAVALALPSFICLDQQNMSPEGNSQVEPCDLYSVAIDQAQIKIAIFYHLKISTRSAQLSHLFNQGINSAELLILEPRCREALKKLVGDRIGNNDLNDYCAPIDGKKLKIVYGIITRKNPIGLSENLPLFSKISLMRCFRQLELMQIPAVLTYIPDVSAPKDKYSSYPTVIVEVIAKGKSKVECRVIAGQSLPKDTVLSGCCKEIRESVAGTKFEVYYQLNDNQEPYTHHSWKFEPAV